MDRLLALSAWPSLHLRQLLRPVSAWLSPLLLLLAWDLSARRGLLPAQLLPSPWAVLAAFRDLLASGELQFHLGISLHRLGIGFALGAVLGILFGAVQALSPGVDAYTRPTFNALRQIPTLALVPLLILMLGVDEALKIVILVKATFFPVAIATHDGVRQLPRAWLEVARVYRLPPPTLLRRIVLPATVPPVLTGLRIALGRGWMVLVAVELLAADSGLGQMLEMNRQMFRLDVVLVGVIVAGAIGFALDKALRLVEQRLLRWQAAGAPA